MFAILAVALLLLIFALPLMAAFAVVDEFSATPWSLLLGVPAYVLSFVLVAGVLSLPWQRAVVPGRFVRDLRDRRYRGRRLYGLCWTSVYYFTPLYFVCLSLPPLKWLLFRLFGYRGSMEFTLYPDTWIRDLPLLRLGAGAYVSNKATLGTNLCLNDGTILVDRITLADGAMVGHLSMLAPGVVMEERSEIGIGTAIGIKARLGPRVSIGGICTVSHLSVLEEGVSTGTAVDIGAAVRLGPGIHVPAGAFVPNRTRWTTQVQADVALGHPEDRGDGVAQTAAPSPLSQGPRNGDITVGGKPAPVGIPAARPRPSPNGSEERQATGERPRWNAFE